VSVTPFENRIASLEGSYHQMSDRLNSIDRRLGDHSTEFRAVRSEIASQFRWTIATVFGSWVTLLTAILLHHS
jgi:hypothetical protein